MACKHTDCIITFQKGNGDIIMRPRMNAIDLKIGDTTSMGWTVLDIHYLFYDGNYYHEEDYLHLWKKMQKMERESIKKKIGKKVMKLAQNLMAEANKKRHYSKKNYYSVLNRF